MIGNLISFTYVVFLILQVLVPQSFHPLVVPTCAKDDCALLFHHRVSVRAGPVIHSLQCVFLRIPRH